MHILADQGRSQAAKHGARVPMNFHQAWPYKSHGYFMADALKRSPAGSVVYA